MKKILFFLFLLIGIYGYGQIRPFELKEKKSSDVSFGKVSDKNGNNYEITSVNTLNNCATPVNNCATPVGCNLVLNGDFEQYSTLPDYLHQIEKACGWFSISVATPDYFNVHAIGNNSMVSIPCNFAGRQNDNLVKKGYAGMGFGKFLFNINGSYEEHYYNETIGTKLNTPLLPDTDYTLTFDVSLAENSRGAIKFQAYLSTTFICNESYSYGNVPISNPSMLLKKTIYSTMTNGWEKITFTFKTSSTAGEQYLYLGSLENMEFTPKSPVDVAGCPPGISTNIFEINQSYYYVDNVKLEPSNSSTFSPPTTICISQNLANLNSYLTGTPSNGVFTGAGVVLNPTTGVYSFNAGTAGVGVHQIAYTYNTGCITSNINVISSTTIPLFEPIAICSGAFLSLPSTSINGITGTWSPAVNNLATTTYTFTPNAGQCGVNTTTLTVTVNPIIIPTFATIAPICSGEPLVLPYTSTNGIMGLWSPEVNNLTTTTYTFTPITGECVNPVTLTVIVNPTPAIIPTFAPIENLCTGWYFELPTTSTNGITGTWEDNTDGTLYETTTFTFTPNSGQCAKTTTLTITVKDCSQSDGQEGCDIQSLILFEPDALPSYANSNYYGEHRRHDWIETNTNYALTFVKDVALIAGKYIVLKPNTHIASGSKFHAFIEKCDFDEQLYAKVKNPKSKRLGTETENLDTEIDSIIFYPNPTKDIVTISAKALKINEVILVSLGSQILLTVNNVNSNSYPLDLTKYPNGTYIVIVKTSDGNEIKQKIIKN